MLDAILAVIRLLVHPELRSAVASIRASANESSASWARELKRSRARFRPDEKIQALAFGNILTRGLREADLTDRTVEHFEIVFGELIENAFRHGARNRRRGRITITCDYSPWFVRLRVSDPGDGFPFETYRALPEYERRGLGIVSKLAGRFEANRRGNIVTATIVNHDEVIVTEYIEADTDDILTVRVTNQELWHYSEASWEPLRERIEQSGKMRVLVDCSVIKWTSATTREGPSRILSAFKTRAGYRLAFVVSHQSLRLFDFTHLDSEYSRVFPATGVDAAKRWLRSDDSGATAG